MLAVVGGTGSYDLPGLEIKSRIGGVAAHLSTARPLSAALHSTVRAAGERIGVHVHCRQTHVCVEGSRLGTRAESHFLRQVSCHLVGTTNVP